MLVYIYAVLDCVQMRAMRFFNRVLLYFFLDAAWLTRARIFFLCVLCARGIARAVCFDDC